MWIEELAVISIEKKESCGVEFFFNLNFQIIILR